MNIAGAAITQTDVDALASFVEAADELALEPFFGKDEQFSESRSDEHHTIFNLGDRFHFRSALISFRRIWMPSEPSHWRKIIKILRRDGIPPEISNQASFHDHSIQEFISRGDPYLKQEVEGSRVIDLWLNTVFAHGGISGPNKRSDFEALSGKYGQGRFEYAFRLEVKWTGEMFRELSTSAAKPALDLLKDQLSLQPSFHIGAAFGIKRKEVTRDGELIIRQASSEHFSEETFEQRFRRVLKRRHFDNIGFVLRQFDRTSVEILRALFTASSFSNFLSNMGGSLEIFSDNAEAENPVSDGFCASCTIHTDFFQQFGRAIIWRDGRVRTTRAAAAVLDGQLAKFREELLSDS